jgi:UDP-N-acetylmuramoyl-tripeptide--D-alanyl-D-alanine ligase
MIYRKLEELLPPLPGAEWHGEEKDLKRPVHSISTDTRMISSGDVFVALEGENFDGHAFVEKLSGLGAAGAVVSRSWAAENAASAGVPLIAVDDPLQAYGDLARHHRRSLSIPVVAVAGSNGKTTTKELTAAVLGATNNVLKTEGNLNNLIGVPATMLRINEEHTAAVIEIGTNTPGEIARLCEILEPTHGVITNIGREHLELLGSLDGVAEEEGELFRYLERSGGLAFINADDPYILKVMGENPKRVMYGVNESADVRARIEHLDENGAPVIRIDTRDEATEPFGLRLPGLHSATNAVAAAAIGLSFHVPLGDVVRVLSEFQPLSVSGGYARLSPLRMPNGALVLNDTYNANPDSMMVALETLAAMKCQDGGRRIVVLGEMRELGRSSAEEHSELGKAIQHIDCVDEAYLFGPEMKHTRQALEGSRVEAKAFEDKQQLIAELQQKVRKGDIVLVKGSRGTEMEEVVNALVPATPVEH